MQLLRFTYRYIQLPSCDGLLEKKTETYLPMIPCQFKSGDRTTSLLYGLLDSGSHCILIPRAVSEELDLRLRDAPPLIGIGGTTSRMTAYVDIRIGSHGRFTDLKNIEISVLLNGETVPIVLGRDPIFRLYDITFSDADLKVTLNPHKHKSKKRK